MYWKRYISRVARIFACKKNYVKNDTKNSIKNGIHMNKIFNYKNNLNNRIFKMPATGICFIKMHVNYTV